MKKSVKPVEAEKAEQERLEYLLRWFLAVFGRPK